ncbi:MAG: glycosyltransferase family 2 protein [Candidatus Pacebacteria bacterium]|nr:glycosyltransferase family 2 protein [Candidatus Paceibacterota bacterium]
MNRFPLSVIILTKNSEITLEKALESVRWAQEVLIIDDGSSDSTKNIADKFGARWISSPLKDFANQRNNGLSLATHDWVLFLDSDEYLTLELQHEIQTLLPTTRFNGFLIKRTDVFMQKTLWYGETGRMHLLRLAKRNAGVWYRPVHEVWNISGGIGKLKHSIMHTPHVSVTSFLEKINLYTEMEKIQKDPLFLWLIKLLYYPKVKFFVNYVLKCGFLDGFPGFAMAYMMSLHSLIVRIKQYET